MPPTNRMKPKFPKAQIASGPQASTGAPDMQPLDRRSLLKLIHATIPLPTREENCADGSLVFVGGDPGEVVIRVAGSRITISVFSIALEGPHTPVVHTQPIMSMNWRVIPAVQLTSLLQDMIETARQLRQSQFRKCVKCGETKPPEWMHDEDSCQGCVA
ncbi:MAG: hypothetical protein U0941_08555 [Planctomycetaceae bacterium]